MCCFGLRIHGNNLQEPEKLLVIANHESFLDGLLIGLFLPITALVLVHTTVLNNPVFRFLLCPSASPRCGSPASPLAMKKVIKLLETANRGDLPGRTHHHDREPDEGL